MGFRFRKSIKLSSGVRMNIGKTGTSFSFGGKGARVTVGSRKTTTTFGIPGSGLSYSTSSYHSKSSRGGRRSGPTKKEMREQRYLSALNRIESAQENYEQFLRIGNKSPAIHSEDYFKNQLKFREYSHEIYDRKTITKREYMDEKIKELHSNSFIKASIAGFFLGWITWGNLEEMCFAGAIICLLVWLVKTSLLLFKLNKESILIVKENEYELMQLQSQHPQIENQRIESLRSLLDGDVNILEDEVEKAIELFNEEIEDFEHSFDMDINFELKNSSLVLLDVDLPEIEDVVPNQISKALKSGEVTSKDKKEKDKNEEYAKGCIGIAFNLATRILNVSPVLETVVISAYTQRIDRSVGRVRDQYIYEITFTRTHLQKLDFHHIDVIEAAKNMKYKMILKRDFSFEEIEVDVAA